MDGYRKLRKVKQVIWGKVKRRKVCCSVQATESGFFTTLVLIAASCAACASCATCPVARGL